MEQVKRQTVNKFILIAIDWRKISEKYYSKDYGDSSRKDLKRAENSLYDQKSEFAHYLEKQCKDKISFYEFSDIANIIVKRYKEFTDFYEVFCKIIAILGVEVVE